MYILQNSLYFSFPRIKWIIIKNSTSGKSVATQECSVLQSLPDKQRHERLAFFFVLTTRHWIDKHLVLHHLKIQTPVNAKELNDLFDTTFVMVHLQEAQWDTVRWTWWFQIMKRLGPKRFDAQRHDHQLANGNNIRSCNFHSSAVVRLITNLFHWQRDDDGSTWTRPFPVLLFQDLKTTLKLSISLYKSKYTVVQLCWNAMKINLDMFDVRQMSFTAQHCC